MARIFSAWRLVIFALTLISGPVSLDMVFAASPASAQMEVEQNGEQENASWNLKQGNQNYNNQQYEEAISFYSRAAELYEQDNDLYKVAEALNRTGLSHRHLQDYSTAIAFYEKSLEIYQRLGSKSDEAKLFNNIGVSLYYLERYHDSIQKHQMALRIRGTLGSKQDIIESLENMMKPYKKLGDEDKVLALRQTVVEMKRTTSKSSNDPRTDMNRNDSSNSR